MSYRTILLVIFTLLFAMVLFTISTPYVQAQAPEGQEYIVQVDDWLSKLSDKFYGDIFAYPDIVEATNIKAAEDSNFTLITDPDVIEVSQKLWLPAVKDANIITEGGIPFKPAPIEALGTRTVVPDHWPAVENDPFLDHVWSAGLFSFVDFSTTPGTNGQAGLAQLLRTTIVALNNGSIGGELSEEQFGDRTWTIYTRGEGAITLAAAATVQDKVIYQIRLSAENSQNNTILRMMLENFEIANPAAAQQVITLQAPRRGVALTNPFELRGVTSQYPFKGLLSYRVTDADGRPVGQGPFEVVGRLGNPSTFALAGAYDVQVAGPGTVEVAEISTSDGTIIAIDRVEVMLEANPPGYEITIQDPLSYESVASPVQIRGKTTDRPFEGRLNYRIVDATGEEIGGGVFETDGQVGQVNAFDGFAEFIVTENGPGRIEVFDIRPADGTVFSIDTVNVWLTRP